MEFAAQRILHPSHEVRLVGQVGDDRGDVVQGLQTQKGCAALEVDQHQIEFLRWVARRHPEILRARLVISGSTGSDRMVLKVESRVRSEELGKRIAESVRDVTKLRSDVEWVDADGLPNDGKVIDDIRTYE